jgi:hypothetical protein
MNGLTKCPKCGKDSLIKKPRARIMSEKFGCMVHTADEHVLDCLGNQCGYVSDVIHIKTEIGNRLSLPWYKRIFKI